MFDEYPTIKVTDSRVCFSKSIYGFVKTTRSYENSHSTSVYYCHCSYLSLGSSVDRYQLCYQPWKYFRLKPTRVLFIRTMRRNLSEHVQSSFYIVVFDSPPSRMKILGEIFIHTHTRTRARVDVRKYAHAYYIHWRTHNIIKVTMQTRAQRSFATRPIDTPAAEKT